MEIMYYSAKDTDAYSEKGKSESCYEEPGQDIPMTTSDALPQSSIRVNDIVSYKPGD